MAAAKHIAYRSVNPGGDEGVEVGAADEQRLAAQTDDGQPVTSQSAHLADGNAEGRRRLPDG